MQAFLRVARVADAELQARADAELQESSFVELCGSVNPVVPGTILSTKAGTQLKRRAREQFNALYSLDDLLIRSRDGSRLFCTRRILSVQLDCISEEAMV